MSNHAPKSGLTEKVVQLLTPQVLAADTTSTVYENGGTIAGGAAVPSNGVVFEISVAAEGVTLSGTDKIAIILQEGDLANGSDQAAVTDGSLVTTGEGVGKDAEGGDWPSTGALKVLDAPADAPGIYRVQYQGFKKYSSIKLDFSGTHGTGTGFAINARPLNRRYAGILPGSGNQD